MKEQEITMPTFEQFKQALNIFAKDLSIVGHPQDPVVSPFAEPREYGQYNLALLPQNMSEADFIAQIQTKTKIIISCMDKRAAHPVWKKLRGWDALFLSFAGGPVQSKGERRGAMETIANYLFQVKTRFLSDLQDKPGFEGGKSKKDLGIQEVILVGHDHICGAVKYFLGGKSLPDFFHVKTGSLREQEIMKQLIYAGAEVWIKTFGKDKVKSKLAIIDETHKTVVLQDISSVKPLMIEDLRS